MSRSFGSPISLGSKRGNINASAASSQSLLSTPTKPTGTSIEMQSGLAPNPVHLLKSVIASTPPPPLPLVAATATPVPALSPDAPATFLTPLSAPVSVLAASAADAKPRCSSTYYTVHFPPGPLGLELEPFSPSTKLGCRVRKFVSPPTGSPSRAYLCGSISIGDRIVSISSGGASASAVDVRNNSFDEVVRAVRDHVSRAGPEEPNSGCDLTFEAMHGTSVGFSEKVHQTPSTVADTSTPTITNSSSSANHAVFSPSGVRNARSSTTGARNAFRASVTAIDEVTFQHSSKSKVIADYLSSTLFPLLGLDEYTTSRLLLGAVSPEHSKVAPTSPLAHPFSSGEEKCATVPSEKVEIPTIANKAALVRELSFHATSFASPTASSSVKASTVVLPTTTLQSSSSQAAAADAATIPSSQAAASLQSRLSSEVVRRESAEIGLEISEVGRCALSLELKKARDENKRLNEQILGQTKKKVEDDLAAKLLQGEIKKSKDEVERLSSAVGEADARLICIQGESEEKGAVIEGLKKVILSMREESYRVSEANARETMETAAFISGLKETIASHAAAALSLREENSSLAKELAVVASSLKEAEARRASESNKAAGAIARATAAITQSAERETVERNRAERAEREKQDAIRQLEESEENAKVFVERAGKAVNDARSRVEELQAENQFMLNTLQINAEKADAERTAAEVKLNEMASKQLLLEDEMDRQDKRVAALEEEKIEFKFKFKEEAKRREDARREILESKNKLSALEDSKAATESTLQEELKSRIAAENHAANLSSLLASCMDDLGAAMDKVVDLEEEVKQLMIEKEEDELNMKQILSELEEATTSKQDEISAREVVQSNLSRMKELNDDLNKENERIVAVNIELDAAQKQATSTIGILKHEFSEQQKVQQLQAQETERLSVQNRSILSRQSTTERETNEIIAKLEVDNEIAAEEAITLKAEIRNLRDKVASCIANNDLLKVEYEEDAKVVNDSLNALVKEIESIRAERELELMQHEEQVTTLTKEADVTRSSLEKMLQESEKRAHFAVEAAEELSNRNAALEEALQKAIESKESILMTKQHEFSEILAKVEALQATHTIVVSERDSKISELEKQLQALTVEIESQIEEKLQLESEIDDLTQSKQCQIAELIAQVNAFEGMLKQKSELATEEKEAIIAKNVALQLEIDEKVRDMSSRQTEFLKKKDDTIAKCRDDIGILKNVIKTFEDDVESGKAREAMQTEEIAMLLREKATLVDEISESENCLKLQLQEAEARCYEALEMVDDREKLLADFESKMQFKERELQALTKHMEIMDRKMQLLRQQATEEKKGETGSLAAGTSAIEELEVKNVELSCELESCQRYLNQKTSELERALTELKELRSKPLAITAMAQASSSHQQPAKQMPGKTSATPVYAKPTASSTALFTPPKSLQAARKKEEEAIRERAQSKKASAGLETIVMDMERKNNELVAELNAMKAAAAEKQQQQQIAQAPNTPISVPMITCEGDASASEKYALPPPPPSPLNDNLCKRHDEVLAELEKMRASIYEELSPRKKMSREAAVGTSPTGVDDDNEEYDGATAVRDELLEAMSLNLEHLLVELTNARTALQGKEDLLERMSQSLQTHEKDRELLRAEMERMDLFVERAEKIVEQEIQVRTVAQEELKRVKGDIEILKEENESIRKSLQNEMEGRVASEASASNSLREAARKEYELQSRSEETCAALRTALEKLRNETENAREGQRIVSAGVFTLISAIVFAKNKQFRDKKVAFSRWFKFSVYGGSTGGAFQMQQHSSLVRRYEALVNELDAERRRHSQLRIEIARNEHSGQSRMLLLEESTNMLRLEIEKCSAENEVLRRNSEHILRESSTIRENLKLSERMQAIVFMRNHAVRVLRPAFSLWLKTSMIKKGREEVNLAAGMMKKQLEETKIKLTMLKEGLRGGGFLPLAKHASPLKSKVGGDKASGGKVAGVGATAVAGGEQNDDDSGSMSGSFFWELSSDEGRADDKDEDEKGAQFLE